MKLNFKEVFIAKTNDIKYKPTIFSFIIIVICLAILIWLSDFIPVFYVSGTIRALILFCFIYLLLVFIAKIDCISENISRQQVRNKKYKFRHKSIFVNKCELINWLYNYSLPEQIIIKLNDEFHIIEISYDVKGRRGDFINRTTYFDDDIIEASKIEKIIKSSDRFSKIEVFETFDHQNPSLLLDEIKELEKII